MSRYQPNFVTSKAAAQSCSAWPTGGKCMLNRKMTNAVGDGVNKHTPRSVREILQDDFFVKLLLTKKNGVGKDREILSGITGVEASPASTTGLKKMPVKKMKTNTKQETLAAEVVRLRSENERLRETLDLCRSWLTNKSNHAGNVYTVEEVAGIAQEALTLIKLDKKGSVGKKREILSGITGSQASPASDTGLKQMPVNKGTK